MKSTKVEQLEISAPRLLKREEISSITKQQIEEMERQVVETMGTLFRVNFNEDQTISLKTQTAKPLPPLPNTVTNIGTSVQSTQQQPFTSPEISGMKPRAPPKYTIGLQKQSEAIHGESFRHLIHKRLNLNFRA